MGCLSRHNSISYDKKKEKSSIDKALEQADFFNSDTYRKMMDSPTYLSNH